MNTTLYVGNIPYAASAEELETYFAIAGLVEAVDRLMERQRDRPRGFAFVTMANCEGAEVAMRKLNGVEFQGRNLRVVRARPK